MAALTGAPAERRILVAHGTRSASGIATVRALADAVAQHTGPVEVAFVDVRGPSPSDLLRGSDRPTVLVPAFLAAGYHVRTDVPRHVADSGHPAVTVTAALGPDRGLVGALMRRLREAGWRPGETVVLGATGSSDPHARADAVASARIPGRRLFLAAYQLAEGLFHDRLAEAGADGVAAPLGTAPEVVDLLVGRFAQTR